MKIGLMARYEIGIDIIKFILNSFPEDIAVIIAESKDSVYNFAIKNKIPVFIYESSQQIVTELKKNNIKLDFGFMVWWTYIIKEPLISYPIYGFINTHPSLLPHGAGSMSHFWSLVEDTPYGVSLHKVNSNVDAGDIIAQKEISKTWIDTDETLYQKSIESMRELFIESYSNIREKKFNLTPQNRNAGSYHKTSEVDTAIKINLEKKYSGKEILNLLRARTYPKKNGCWFKDGDKEYEVRITIKQKDQIRQ